MGKKKIGLLGGIGPESTGNFYLDLISKYQDKGYIHSNEDFPQIMVNSIPAPELIFERFQEKDLGPYLMGLKELEAWGAHFIAMICNTIHSFHDILQAHITVPIIDLRREIKNILYQKKPRTITILGTPLTIKNRSYQFDGITCVDIDESEKKALSAAIFDFNKGEEKQRQIEIVESITSKYIEKSDLLIAGCSEIGLMLRDKSLPLIDPMDVLAEAVVEYPLRMDTPLQRVKPIPFPEHTASMPTDRLL